MTSSFHDGFVELFNAEFHRLYRYLDRLSGDADLAADLAQDAFVRLYRRGTLPDVPEAWLITVATNLFRNARATRSRRARLLTPARASDVAGDPPGEPGAALEQPESRERVRAAIDRLSDRERQLLLLRADGYSYRDIAVALNLNERSVGTLLARAKRAFLAAFRDGPPHAP
jgi:RNA polymerase sigma-70 factor (ECF subfamily)